MGRRKNVSLTEKDIETLKSIYSTGNRSSNKFLFFMHLFSAGILDYEILNALKRGNATACQKEILRRFEILFERINPDLCSPLFNRLRRKQKEYVYLSYGLSDVERFLLMQIVKAHRKGEKAKARKLFAALKRAGYKIDDNDAQTKAMYLKIISRLRKRVSYLKRTGKIRGLKDEKN